MSKATPPRRKHADADKNAVVSFAGEMESDEQIDGTPNVTATPSGLTFSGIRANTAAIELSNGEAVAIGQAVQFNVTGGTSGTKYVITVTCDTDSNPAQTLVAECSLTVT